jgi:hypothetical protein
VPTAERKMFITTNTGICIILGNYLNLRKKSKYYTILSSLGTLAGGVPTVDTKMFITINASF